MTAITNHTALTVDIVSAFLAHNALSPDRVPDLIRDVHGTLAELDAPAPAPEPDRVPAVSIKASVKPDHVTCLECGHKGAMLKRHLMTAHALEEGEYRARWGLPASHPLTSPNYSARRADLAKQHGLGRKPGQGKA